MRRRFIKSMLALLPLGWIGLTTRNADGTERIQDMIQDRQDDEKISADFAIKDLSEEQGRGMNAYLRFFDNKTMSMGLYALPAGAKDTQSPHDQDEVYVVTQGKAVLDVEGDDHPVIEGSIVFVKAKAAHHFHSIEHDLLQCDE